MATRLRIALVAVAATALARGAGAINTTPLSPNGLTIQSTSIGYYSAGPINNFWNAIGVSQDPSTDGDIYLYPTSAFTASMASSSSFGGYPDFVMVDGNVNEGLTYYPKVNRFSGAGDLYVHWERTSNALGDAGVFGSFPSVTDYIRCYDTLTSTGNTYYFGLHYSDNEPAQPGMFLFERNNGTFQGKTQAVVKSDFVANPSNNRVVGFSYLAQSAGYQALAVVNPYANGALSYSLYRDTTAPAAPTFIGPSSVFLAPGSGPYTANWSSVADPQTGFYTYALKLGTTDGGSQVAALNTTNTSYAFTVPPNTTYYLGVSQLNNALMTSPTAKLQIQQAMSVKQARKETNGTNVLVAGRVTASFSSSGEFWLEDEDHSAGIRVVAGNPANAPAVNSFSYVSGSIDTSVERTIIMSGQALSIPSLTPAPPLLTSSYHLGGQNFVYGLAVTPGPQGGVGLLNTGLLMRVTGRVVAIDGSKNYITIDDGSFTDPTKQLIITAWRLPAPPTVAVGDYIEATGISSIQFLPDHNRPTLVLRTKDDIQYPRVAYVYYNDFSQASDFRTLLRTKGVEADLVDLSSITAATNFSKYRAVLIGADTKYVWGSTQANAVKNTAPRVLGLGRGGAYYFDAAGSSLTHLHTWTQSNVDGCYSPGSVPAIWTYPTAIPNPTSVHAIQTSGTADTVAEYLTGTGVSALGIEQTDNVHAFIAYDTAKPKYILWGYANGPSTMTTEGKTLFSNTLYYLTHL